MRMENCIYQKKVVILSVVLRLEHLKKNSYLRT